jgi:hypothetical protein
MNIWDFIFLFFLAFIANWLRGRREGNSEPRKRLTYICGGSIILHLASGPFGELVSKYSPFGSFITWLIAMTVVMIWFFSFVYFLFSFFSSVFLSTDKIQKAFDFMVKTWVKYRDLLNEIRPFG